MNKLTSFIFLAILFSHCGKRQVPTTGVNVTDTSGLRVLTYNIHHANPPSKADVIDLDAIAAVINQQQPDIVALQEIDARTTRSGKDLHESEQLAAKTGMSSYFAKGIDYGGGEYGIAILSKYSMTNMKRHPLPTLESTKGEPRVLATAEVSLPGNKKIVFACTHLDAQSKDTNRVLQITRILEILKEEKLPVILAGDLNAVPASTTISKLDSYFTRSCVTSSCPFTISEVNPRKTIDFISYAPRNKFVVKLHRVVDEKYASDHLPVFAVFGVK